MEGILEGMDISTKEFKSLNRLFLRANHGSSSRNTSGLGLSQAKANPLGSDLPTPVSTPGGNEWSHRPKIKPQHQHQTGQLSPANSESTPDPFSEVATPVFETLAQQQEDQGENPVGTIRMMLKAAPHGQGGLQRALYWLSIMVRSGVHVPAQAFMDCCDSLVDMSHTPSLIAVETLRDAAPTTPGAPATATFQQATAVQSADVLENSLEFLQAGWDYTVLSTQRLSESDMGQILDTVLSTNQEEILKIISTPLQDVDTDMLER
jgi:hypothetical protein